MQSSTPQPLCRYLVIVAPTAATSFDAIRYAVGGDPSVAMCFDRRKEHRRQQVWDARPERRGVDRRQHEVSAALREKGWAMVEVAGV